MSPLLFNLVIEMLGLAVRHCQDNSGVLINQMEPKVIFYANDAVFFLQDPLLRSFSALQQVIMAFACASGDEVNEQKTILLDLCISTEDREGISALSSAK